MSLIALTKVLTGTQPTGHLPVTVRTADLQHTLCPYGSGIGYPAHH